MALRAFGRLLIICVYELQETHSWFQSLIVTLMLSHWPVLRSLLKLRGKPFCLFPVPWALSPQPADSEGRQSSHCSPILLLSWDHHLRTRGGCRLAATWDATLGYSQRPPVSHLFCILTFVPTAHGNALWYNIISQWLLIYSLPSDLPRRLASRSSPLPPPADLHWPVTLCSYPCLSLQSFAHWNLLNHLHLVASVCSWVLWQNPYSFVFLPFLCFLILKLQLPVCVVLYGPNQSAWHCHFH